MATRLRFCLSMEIILPIIAAAIAIYFIIREIGLMMDYLTHLRKLQGFKIILDKNIDELKLVDAVIDQYEDQINKLDEKIIVSHPSIKEVIARNKYLKDNRRYWASKKSR